MGLNIPNLQQLASTLPQDLQAGLRSVLNAQDKLNQDIQGLFSQVFSPSWHYPTLTNGWNAVTDNRKPRFTRLADGLVVISGDIQNGTTGVPCFTLPSGYWPLLGLESFGIWSTSNTLGRLYIDGTNGNVIVGTGTNTFEVNISVCFMGA